MKIIEILKQTAKLALLKFYDYEICQIGYKDGKYIAIDCNGRLSSLSAPIDDLSNTDLTLFVEGIYKALSVSYKADKRCEWLIRAFDGTLTKSIGYCYTTFSTAMLNDRDLNLIDMLSIRSEVADFQFALLEVIDKDSRTKKSKVYKGLCPIPREMILGYCPTDKDGTISGQGLNIFVSKSANPAYGFYRLQGEWQYGSFTDYCTAERLKADKTDNLPIK